MSKIYSKLAIHSQHKSSFNIKLEVCVCVRSRALSREPSRCVTIIHKKKKRKNICLGCVCRGGVHKQKSVRTVSIHIIVWSLTDCVFPIVGRISFRRPTVKIRWLRIVIDGRDPSLSLTFW
uniref:(northern house mosquito) hypothetical protein n=1 Tax=Culex pipiens TaxID=7175 RepID=A0A8D8CF09_CULPI